MSIKDIEKTTDLEVLEDKELPIEEQREIPPIPKDGIPSNIVMFGSREIEIKPTKMKYQRNRSAAFYTIIENYPMAEIAAIGKGYFDEERDGDKCVYDWLVAVTDDPELVREEYNNIDTGTIEQLLEIFLRLNKIGEKRENLKKQEQERGVRKEAK